MQTTAYLAPYARLCQPAEQAALPAVYDAVDPTQCRFPGRTVSIQPGHAWYCAGGPPARLLRNGGVQMGENVLCTDYHTDEVIRDSFRLEKRSVLVADVLVAPFAHYQDPVFIWGYYDFLFMLAAKLCRIQQAMPEQSFAETTVAYPLLGTSYEQEFLAVMGFRPECIRDSRLYNVRAATCLLANNGDFYYPSPTDVELLRNCLAPLIQEPAEKHARLYVSRAGRRRIENEAELVAMLGKYGFTVMEDKPRTLAEQLTLYHHASFIVGPHGASFSNIIWCQPGAHLFEIFAPDYAPDYFLYLAQLAGVGYSACYQPAAGGGQLPPIERNIRVAVADVERGVVAALAKAAGLAGITVHA
ncbi:glycosyltransferase family 61 protein [Hymenobacter caeli]|uniref:Glycosyltransferase 61 catalytic domain-containing protein n=1 Tax=Hymenobacter caeli TaxID=2735894 RepID=A0ABX2FLY9_9BACT|nr:glycosyltransferase family 61 protein [Hymenobacter caeli]NRT18026.1 hypothetical protein [Hymenobacter caeli]